MPPLSSAELAAVEDAVRTVSTRDEDRLRVIAPDAGDLYRWTRDYGTHDRVDLVVPPGSVKDWRLDATDVDDGSKHVVVEMWTRQEGRSDLSLELELREDEAGRWQPHVLDLHVL